MKKAAIAVLFFTLLSCGNNKKMMLPVAGTTVIKTMLNHSEVYLTFDKNENDTLIKVNKSSSISNTNWIFDIDKRLPLRLVIPQVAILQLKKSSSPHQELVTENYYSYSDSIGKNLAFLPFTKITYRTEKPVSGNIIYFGKNKTIKINTEIVALEKLQDAIDKIQVDSEAKFVLAFDKNLRFNDYLNDKILVWNLKIASLPLNSSTTEFIY